MDVLTKIDSLTVSEGWKSKFRMIAAAEPISLGMIPKFNNLNAYKKIPKINFWALFFGIFYYVAKGMWKKGLVLLGIVIVLSQLLIVMLGDSNGSMAGLGLVVIYGLYANFDYYRKMVLNENFWI